MASILPLERQTLEARRSDELHARLLDAVAREGAAGILEDADDVWRDREVDDFLGDDGFPDVEKVREAGRELATAKPHLARRRPVGDVDQGARAERTEEPSLAAILRERAT